MNATATTAATTPAPRAPGRLRRRIKRTAITLGTLYALWCALLYFAQSSMLFPRSLPNALGFVQKPPADFEPWTLTTPEGSSVEAWFLPGAGRGPDNPGPAVIYCHGNAELIDHVQEVARWYADRGISVLLAEYRGYGRSTGSPSQHAIAGDMAAFYDMLARRPEVDRARIITHGRSLGGGIAAQLSHDRPTAALVLNSTFTSVASMAPGYGVPPFLVTNPFHTDDVLRAYANPVLITHGTRDDIIPFAHGRRLAGLAHNATFVELACSHNDFPGDDRAKYEDSLESFLGAHGFLNR